MPTYSYRCNDCGHEFDIRQRMSEDPISVCPNCDGVVRRVVTSVGVVFKGSGFYVTDNRNGKSGKSKTKDKTSKASTSESKKSTSKDKPKEKAKTSS
jgi:putative FmdB family regulatory protein